MRRPTRVPLRILVALLAVAGAVRAGDGIDAGLRAIVPAPADLRWTAIPWRAALWDAVVDAHGLRKPILLWAMNGHPLACT
jgi:hypothetical protein